MEPRIYTLSKSERSAQDLLKFLSNYPEIKFISLVAVDFGNNHTDEKIPVSLFKTEDDLQAFLESGIQTDGSSVHLPGIATINNAKVDLVPDLESHWVIDYHYAHTHTHGLPVGTLVIPSFLHHQNLPTCSRSVLKKAKETFKTELIQCFKNYPFLCEEYEHLTDYTDIEDVVLTAATELEFWVKTPNDQTDIEALSASQELKEQYWKRTKGSVRTAMEASLLKLDALGFHPEMGHKEVGGVTSKLAGSNLYTHIMEQLEIDWLYDDALAAADKELIAKDIIYDVFEAHGLEVTFEAKPLEGVAGSGEHHHLGIALKLKSGKKINLFSPKVMKAHFLTTMGYGAMMGILKNYEAINPFVSCTNDSLNRLKPGFEAPVCTVASLGQEAGSLTRNRTVLLGLIRDLNQPLATRFELRSPNPNSNSYMLLAASYMAALDGILSVVKRGSQQDDLLKALSKKFGEEHFYLEKNRMYRSEEDVFSAYSQEERDQYFGGVPTTVYDNFTLFDQARDKSQCLLYQNVFSHQMIESYKEYMITEWAIELKDRIIPNNRRTIRRLKSIHVQEDLTDLDLLNWEKIKNLKTLLMKDTLTTQSLFTQIITAIDSKEYEIASRLQISMNEKMSELTKLYLAYRKNLTQFAQ